MEGVIMALQYLLDPAFQVVNTAGKPATGGYINVYVHGTRERYYCASDFDGTLHPFNIPLDSLGSNVVLADAGRSYDVYVFNRYGGELYTRYDVMPGAAGGISADQITSTDGSITVTDTGTGVDLSVNGSEPSVLRAGANPLETDGNFEFYPKESTGTSIEIDENGVWLAKGWYHYDVTLEMEWAAPAANSVVPVFVTVGGNFYRVDFDLTFRHSDTLQVSGEMRNPHTGPLQFEVAVSGIPEGAVLRVNDLGLHTITGIVAGQGGASYEAGSGISIVDDVIYTDPEVVATLDELATKQDIIADLDEIREGAASGMTAVHDPDYVHTDNNFTGEDVTKLAGIEAGAQVNVKSDWLAGSGDAEILNKPSIPTKTSDLTNDSGYITLSDVPAQQNADWTATSGVQEILNKPSIPSKTSDLTNDSGYITISDVPAQQNADWNASSGVTEILNKPVIPSKTSQLTNDSGYITSADLPAPLTAGSGIDIVSDVINARVDGSTVMFDSNGRLKAASGLFLATYGTTTFAEIDAAYSANRIVYCFVPVSGGQGRLAFLAYKGSGNYEFQYYRSNSSGVDSVFVYKVNTADSWTTTERDAQQPANWTATSGATRILNKPTIPSKTSDLTNDSGYITLAEVPAQAQADWAQSVSSAPDFIKSKPTTKDLVAGANITITEGSTTVTIAASVSSYSAGSGIDITSGVISADTTVLATKSDLPVIGTITV